MKSAIRGLKAVIILAAATVLPGCQKELCYDHSHMVDLRVDFDWTLSPDAEPRTMVVRLFHPDGSHYAVYELTSTVSEHIRVEAGEYILLCHNGEMENVVEGGNTYSEYNLSTKSKSLLSPMGRTDYPAPPRPGSSRAEPIRNTPDRIYTACCTSLRLIPKTDGQSITLQPVEATAHYTVTVTDIENLTPATEISGALTGMSEQWNLSTARPAGASVTHPVAFTHIDEHTIRAEFYVFGHCHDTDTPHYFSVYTSDNVYKDYDITRQIHDAEDPRHVYIDISGLVLPQPGTGITPGVSGWGEVVNTDINMH